MKKSKIKKYQDKLDLLERSPEEYFGTSAPQYHFQLSSLSMTLFNAFVSFLY